MPFFRALVVMLPFAVALAVSGNEVMAHLSLLTLCLFFVAERLQFGLVQITFHWLVSLAGFLLLFHLRDNALLFAGACGLLTAAALYPQRWGRELTLVGKWSFVPAVYLACEIGSAGPSTGATETVDQFLLLSPLAVVVTVGARLLFHRLSAQRGPWRHHVWRPGAHGEPSAVVWVEILAAVVGIVIAAALAEKLGLANSQWIIWSAGSVAMVGMEAASRRLRDRLTGALVGVPLGFLLGELLPASHLVYSFAVMGIMLTFFAFPRYVIEFASRCLLVSLAATVLSGTPEIAGERIENVLLGGAIGYLAIVGAKILAKAQARRKLDA